MEMNKFVKGMAIGVLAPTLAFLLVKYTSLEQAILPGKPHVIIAIALLINLIGIRFQFKKGQLEVGRGWMLVTFVSMLLYFYLLKK